MADYPGVMVRAWRTVQSRSSRLTRLRRALGATAVTVSLAVALTACEANQINWSDHAYTVSSSCLAAQQVTVHNGTGIGTAHNQVTVVNVAYGDVNHDGVQDAAVLLQCADTNRGGHSSSEEIQLFTRDAKFITRLLWPNPSAGRPFGSQFSDLWIGTDGDAKGLIVTRSPLYVTGDRFGSPSSGALCAWFYSKGVFTPTPIIAPGC